MLNVYELHLNFFGTLTYLCHWIKGQTLRYDGSLHPFE